MRYGLIAANQFAEECPLRVSLTLLRAVLAFGVAVAAGAAHAVWTQPIEISGTERVPTGASVTLVLDSDQEIDGQVEERDDRQVLVFVLPDDGASQGLLRIDSGDRSRSLRIDDLAPGRTVIVDLRDFLPLEISAEPAVPQRRVRIRVGGGAGLIGSDYFANVISDNAGQLVGILNDLGGTGTQVADSADDRTSGVSVLLGVAVRIDDRNAIYVHAGYLESDHFDARVAGRTDLFGNDAQIISAGESELDVLSLAVGVEHGIGEQGRWQVYAGLGAMRSEFNDRSRTVTRLNGVEIDTFSSRSDEKDDALFVEAGVRYRLPVRRSEWLFDAGFRRSNETFFDAHMSEAYLRLIFAI